MLESLCTVRAEQKPLKGNLSDKACMESQLPTVLVSGLDSFMVTL